MLLMSGLVGAILAGRVSADPGQGIHYGQWTFNPYVDVSATYDSNVKQSGSGGNGDVFGDATLGLRAGCSLYDFEFKGLGFLSARKYSDNTDSDFGAGGEFLRGKYGDRDQVEIEVDQTFRRTTDIDRYGSEAAVGGVSPDSVLDVSARSRRDINQVGISAGKNVTDKLQLDAGYRFDDINYDQAALADLRNHVGQIEAAYKVTDKSAGLLMAKAAIQENRSSDDSANYVAARLGLKTEGTDKLVFKGSAGFQRYSPPDGDSETGFNFDLIASWIATEKLGFEAGGRNGSQMSSLYANNGTDYQIYWLGATCRINPTITTTLSGAYRIDNYMNPVPSENGPVDRKDKGFAARLRADYQAPAKFLQLYAEAAYEDSSSNVNGYDDVRIALGTILVY